MQHQKPIISATSHISRVKHPEIAAYLDRPEISTSLAFRAGIMLLIEKEEGHQTFEVKVIQLLEQIVEIVSALSGGVVLQKDAPTPDRYDDPFLDSSL